MTESKEIEDLKKRWRIAMKERETAIKRVNHYSQMIDDARRKEELGK